MPHQELVVRWLGEAYGMEQSVHDVVSEQLPHIEGHDELARKTQDYLDQTAHHLNVIDGSIARLHGASSALEKGGLLRFWEGARHVVEQGIQSSALRALILNYAAQHYQIATYKALIKAAEGTRDGETVQMCREIVREEEAMATWIAQHLDEFVRPAVRVVSGKVAQQGEPEEALSIAGTLQSHYMYVVFDGDDEAHEAAQALAGRQIEPVLLQGAEAAHSFRSQQGGAAGLVGAVERMMRSWGGEVVQAEHYASILESGRVILAIPAPHQQAADEILALVKQHGGHDVTYMSATGMEHMPGT